MTRQISKLKSVAGFNSIPLTSVDSKQWENDQEDITDCVPANDRVVQ